METCKTCGSLLLPQKIDDKRVLVCKSCGTQKKSTSSGISEKTAKAKAVEIIDSKDSDIQHPIAEKECPKCNNPESYWWTVQTRASDEPATRFHKCVKCKYTWREY